MIYDISQLKNIIEISHLAGFGISLAGVVSADLLGLKLLFSTTHRPRAKDFKRLHAFTLFGLVLLWIPTFAFAAMQYGSAGFPPGVFMDFAIAGLLSVNAMLIRHQLVQLARYRYRPLILSLSFRSLSGTLTLASLSFVCWVSALCLALFGVVHTLTIPELAQRVPLVWAGFLIGLYFVVILIRGIWTLDRTPRRH